MAPRPPTPPQPSSEMNQIASVIEMMANAIQQQNMAMAHNHQATMHPVSYTHLTLPTNREV